MPEGQPSFLDSIKNDPATAELLKNARGYATARVASGFKGKGKGKGKGPAVTSDKDKAPDTSAEGAVEEVADAAAEGDSPMKMIGKGVKGAVKGAFKQKGGAAKRPTNITDEFFIGVPVSTAYNQWTQYSEFAGFMKGVVSVDQEDDTTSDWKAKIFLSSREWKSRVVEQVPDERIKWKSESEKGTVDGVVTFHEVAPRLTLMMFVLEYRPKGLMEWTGNRWRTVGRRYRLDAKHFRRYIMMEGEETGSWRGTVEDGEVTIPHEDDESETKEEPQPEETGEESTNEQESAEKGRTPERFVQAAGPSRADREGKAEGKAKSEKVSTRREPRGRRG